MFNAKEYVRKAILNVVGENNSIIIDKTPNREMGDIAIPCFNLKIDGINNPAEKANYIKEKIQIDSNYISKIETVGPYLNFTINKEFLKDEVIKNILEEKENYGSSNAGKGKKMLIEHTSINPNASPHIGRSRNSIIGNFIVNLYKFEGYDVNTHYFINDIGKQIAMLLVGIEDANNIDSVTFEDMLSLYVEINEKSKEDSSIEERVFKYLNELENGNEIIRDKFKRITDICVEGQKTIFSKMNITWDHFTHESDFVFEKSTNEILDKLKSLNKLKEDENGRYYVDLEGYDIPTKSPVLVLTREDKTSLYPLRDIAYTIYKISLNPDNNFIVLGEDQDVYMKQISAILDILGYKYPKLITYSFVLLNGEKMATREGKVVLLEDFLTITEEKILEGFKERGQNIDLKKVASIASSCIKYSILNVNRRKNVNFNLAEATNFQGNSAIYLLYNYARISSILEKANKVEFNDFELHFEEKIEYELISSLYEFPDVIKTAVDTKESIVIANFLYDLTQKFSNYYENVSILKEENDIKRYSRIYLLQGIQLVLKNGLNVLGIECFDSL